MKQSERGSSLIEVMVSLLVLAVGLLGVLGMQVQSLKSNQSAYLYTQAAFLANDMYESMQVFPDNSSKFAIAYDANAGTAPDCTSSDCSKDEIVAWAKSNWRTNVENLLPGGKSAVMIEDGAYQIKIQFVVGHDADGEAEMETYSLKTGLL